MPRMSVTLNGGKANQIRDAALDICNGRSGDAMACCLGAVIVLCKDIQAQRASVHEFLDALWESAKEDTIRVKAKGN